MCVLSVRACATIGCECAHGRGMGKIERDLMIQGECAGTKSERKKGSH